MQLSSTKTVIESMESQYFIFSVTKTVCVLTTGTLCSNKNVPFLYLWWKRSFDQLPEGMSLRVQAAPLLQAYGAEKDTRIHNAADVADSLVYFQKRTYFFLHLNALLCLLFGFYGREDVALKHIDRQEKRKTRFSELI